MSAAQQATDASAAVHVQLDVVAGLMQMAVIAVVNRKGGSGKSTLATHLAAYWAGQGMPVMLGDIDRNLSAQSWLKLRQQQSLPGGAAICGGALDPRNVLRLPKGVEHAVVDTPGGMTGFELARLVCHVDVVLIPVCPSMFDLDAAAACLAELRKMPRVAGGRCKVAVVGMRVGMRSGTKLSDRSKALSLLRAWAKRNEVMLVGVLRDASVYVHCVDNGLSLFDLPADRLAHDRAQWAPIIDWLTPLLQPRPLATGATPFKPTYKPYEIPGANMLGAGFTPMPAHGSLHGTATAAAAREELAGRRRPRPPARLDLSMRGSSSVTRGWVERLEQAWSGMALRRLLVRQS